MSSNGERVAAAPSRLRRRLGTGDAVVMGLGSMIGAGVFAAFGPAAAVAGNGVLLGLLVAAVVAYCNATSSAQLAALHPTSGGTYVYARERLSPRWGFVAGWAFVIGKLASCSAMAMTFGSYAAPSLARPAAVSAVLAMTLVNYFGVQKTALVTRVIVAVVLTSLGAVVTAVWMGGEADLARPWTLEDVTAWGVLRSAGFVFFAFAGYARIATLGEEVIDPARVIPRAIRVALSITLAVYAIVAISVLAVGASVVASAPAPLAAAVEHGRLGNLAIVARVGATVASLGVLLSLIVGISRTLFAMAANDDLPSFLAAVHPKHHVPHRAELLVGAIVVVVTVLGDVRSAIGFSSFCVLTYYAITNAAAYSLSTAERRSSRASCAVGFGGCVLIATSLPAPPVLGGITLVAAGALAHRLAMRR